MAEFQYLRIVDKAHSEHLKVMQTSDGPTNPQTLRVLKNRQVNSGSFILHTVCPMQHLQAVIV